MKKAAVFIFTTILSLMVLNCSKEAEYPVDESEVIVLRNTAGDFMKSLKQVLIKEMESKGAFAAVAVCSDTAQVLTETFGEMNDVTIKRVSFRNRNPENYPDEYEVFVIKKFEALHRNGELNEQTESVEVIERNGIKMVRYMKPIIMQAECLTCHGDIDSLAPDVAAVINSRYPEDKAVDFSVGDLRGAVSIIKNMN